MDLHDAFIKAVKSYYAGYDFKNIDKASPKGFQYSFNALDQIHKDVGQPKDQVIDPKALTELGAPTNG